MNVVKLILFTFLVLLGAVSCTTTEPSRYKQHQDSAPQFEHDVINVKNSTPRYLPYRPQNSRVYTVLGKTYTPLSTGKGYTKEGYASWYGQKFHGHLTSNGEIYDMFAMTAAHKTLPLPSFVRVTNLENNKSVIVKVNDRGPFHDNRVIDLSYAAASKLDTLANGVANVKLEVIHVSKNNLYTIGEGPSLTFEQYVGINNLSPSSFESSNVNASANNGWFIQVAALSDQAKIESLSQVLINLYQVSSYIPKNNNIYRLQLGPITNEKTALQLLSELKNNGYPTAYIVKSTLENL